MTSATSTLCTMLTEDFPLCAARVGCPVHERPNAEPWGHLRRVIDPL